MKMQQTLIVLLNLFYRKANKTAALTILMRNLVYNVFQTKSLGAMIYNLQLRLVMMQLLKSMIDLLRNIS